MFDRSVTTCWSTCWVGGVSPVKTFNLWGQSVNGLYDNVPTSPTSGRPRSGGDCHFAKAFPPPLQTNRIAESQGCN